VSGLVCKKKQRILEKKTQKLSIINTKISDIKRNDDLFSIRYEWFDASVQFSDYLADLKSEYHSHRETEGLDPLKEQGFEEKTRQLHNRIKRHLVKALFIFPSGKLKFLADAIRAAELIYLSGEYGAIPEWAGMLERCFSIESLLDNIGEEINLYETDFKADIAEFHIAEEDFEDE